MAQASSARIPWRNSSEGVIPSVSSSARRTASPPRLKPLGVDVADAVEGSVTDQAAVHRALAGCDSVVHCASVYAMHPRQEPVIRTTNVQGTDIVLGEAVRLGVNPIVHVSSLSALFGARGATLGPDGPAGDPPGAYFRSKADSERVARRYQEQGAPVVISYPGAVFGPHDPHFGESNILLRNILRGRAAIFVRGTYWISDVRDVARLHGRLLGERRHTRYLAPTTTLDVADFFSAIRDVTGRRLPSLRLPAWALASSLRLGEMAAQWLRAPFMWPAAGSWALGQSYRVDDSRSREEFGLQPLPLRETLADNIGWLARAGHVSARQAGRAATA